MAQYLISMYQPDGVVPPPEFLEKVIAEIAVLRQELVDQGRWVFSGGLHDASTATVLRPRDGDVLVTDGPYVEGKEHVGGLSVITADDLDGALDWARRLAGVTGLPTEVRPFRAEA